MQFLKRLTARYYRSKVTLKVYVKSHGEGYVDCGLGEFLISIPRSNIFKGKDELEKLHNTEKEKIISLIQSQINNKYGYIDYDTFSYECGFESWEIVKAKIEPQVYWKWIIRLSFIPILLFAALPTYHSYGDGFLFLIKYGIIYFIFYLLYISFLYFICYSLWGKVYGYDVREERAVNRIFILSIIAMSYGVFVDHANRTPTKIEKFIVAPHILLNSADWDSIEEKID